MCTPYNAKLSITYMCLAEIQPCFHTRVRLRTSQRNQFIALDLIPQL